MAIILILLINSLIIANVIAISDVWSYQIWLDPYEKFSVKWNINDLNETITFLCEVQTKGWIGFGLSPNGGMKGSDVIIGWVDDNTGKSYFDDRYATDETLPQIDESQDWLLLNSKQNSTHTIFKFSRPYLTCDTEFDRPITRDTTRLIYAYSDSDPKSIENIQIHKRHERGAKSVLLLSYAETHENEPKETDLKSFVLNVKNITIDKKETTYWCKVFKIPYSNIHVVKYEPFITAGNEPFLHHIGVYSCIHPDFKQLDKYIDDEGADCTEVANMPKDFIHCFNPYFTWGVGGGSFSLPEDVGFPLGDEDSSVYLLLNPHYDNPELIDGIQDSSGLKFYYTEKLRKYEASTMTVGSAMDNRFFIPPNQNQFHISGHCDPKCFEKDIDSNGLNVIAVWPHAHLIAKAMKVRHFRGIKELPWIEFDQNYDFNLQKFRLLNPMVKIQSGDQLTVECNYDSTKKNKTTLGGFATNDEMCVSFIFYYPKMKNSKTCLSGFTEQTVLTLTDTKQAFRDENSKTFISVPNVEQNISFIQYISDKQDWDQKILSNSKDIMSKAMQKSQCYWIKTDNDIEVDWLIGYPEIDEIYSPIEKECVSNNQQSVKHNTKYFVCFFLLIIIIIIVFVIYLVKFRAKPKYNIQTNS